MHSASGKKDSEEIFQWKFRGEIRREIHRIDYFLQEVELQKQFEKSKGFQKNIFQVRKTKETSGGNILTREKDEEVNETSEEEFNKEFRGSI